jgi:hypothetical protein
MKAKMAGGDLAQVVEHLPSKSEALSSTSSTIKKKKFFFKNFFLKGGAVGGKG